MHPPVSGTSRGSCGARARHTRGPPPRKETSAERSPEAVRPPPTKEGSRARGCSPRRAAICQPKTGAWPQSARNSCVEVPGQPRRCTLVWEDGPLRPE
jgi:hypothetical protein